MAEKSHGIALARDVSMLISFNSRTSRKSIQWFRAPPLHPERTEEDALVWRSHINELEENLSNHKNHIHSDYLSGFHRLNLSPHIIPTEESLNLALDSTDWQVRFIDGFIPGRTYSLMISKGVFPVSRTIRRYEHRHHAPNPDLIHDLSGHIPMLFSKEYGDFLRWISNHIIETEETDLDQKLYEAQYRLGMESAKPKPSPEMIRKTEAGIKSIQSELQRHPSPLSRWLKFFLWTIEFGVLLKPAGYRIYGAGILSSIHELRRVASGRVSIESVGPELFSSELNFTGMQNRIFGASSFEILKQFMKNQALSTGRIPHA